MNLQSPTKNQCETELRKVQRFSCESLTYRQRYFLIYNISEMLPESLLRII